jgi:ribose transport system substrate-binding protein
MGYLGVKTLVEHLQGKKVEKRVDTSVMLITTENMGQPAAEALLNPPFKQILGE